MQTTNTLQGLQGRIEAHDTQETVGRLEYEITDNMMRILHTYTYEGHTGKGVAKTLVEAAIAEATKAGYKVDPVCSFAKAYFARYPQYQHMLLIP